MQKLVYSCLSIGLAMVFILSGVLKLIDIAEFYEAISQLMSIQQPFLTLITVTIPLGEIFLGATIIMKLKFSVETGLSVSIFFLIFNLCSIIVGFGGYDCGCFGRMIPSTIGWIAVLRQSIFCILFYFLLILSPVRVMSQRGNASAMFALYFVVGIPLSFLLSISLLKNSNQIGIGTKMPEILTGDALNRTQSKHKSTIILFFTNGCGYCKENIPLFIEASKKYGEKVAFLSVFLSSPLDSARVIPTLADNIPMVYDRSSSSILTLNIKRIPSFFIFDSSRTILSRHDGFLSERALDSLLLNFE